MPCRQSTVDLRRTCRLCHRKSVDSAESIGFVAKSYHEPRNLLSYLLTKNMDVIVRYSCETIGSTRHFSRKISLVLRKLLLLLRGRFARTVVELRDFSRITTGLASDSTGDLRDKVLFLC